MKKNETMTVPADAPDKKTARRIKLRRIAMRTIAVLASVCLFITVVFTCIEAVAFDEGRYKALYKEFGILSDTGLGSMDSLMGITHELLAYCRGDRDSLDMQAVISGESREVFSVREKEHMVDVQRLFVKGFKIRLVAVICLLFLLLLLVYVARRRMLRELARGWLVTVAALGALLVAIGVAFAANFDWAWTQFHYIFFTNDLWLLYQDDMLILMLLKLFSSIVRDIILWSAAALAVLTAGAAAVARLDRKKKKAGGKTERNDPEPQA